MAAPRQAGEENLTGPGSQHRAHALHVLAGGFCKKLVFQTLQTGEHAGGPPLERSADHLRAGIDRHEHQHQRARAQASTTAQASRSKRIRDSAEALKDFI
jgi:hypothetical protein